MGRSKSEALNEARKFVGTGRLRAVLHGEISEEAIQKIIDACSFVLKV